MYQLLRQLLFTLPPETAHEVSLEALAAGERLGVNRHIGKRVAACPVKAMGLEFPNPVGLAAGLDKNGDYFNGLGALGFGFVEIGTVTPGPQPGNPKPRLFRLPGKNAIINRLGFNNRGVDYLISRVKRRRYNGVLGINIGKNFATPLRHAVNDYLLGLRAVYDYADYITVNISSPNTPGLRDLQTEDALVQLLAALNTERAKLMETTERRVPLAIKIAPDMEAEQIKRTAAILVEQGMDAVIATNTTTAREAVKGEKHAEETGGLSGAPLYDPSTEVVRILAGVLGSELPIIGVGGICSGGQAKEKIRAGATLVQVYTGFIYRGPRLIKEAVDAIASLSRF